MALLLLSGSPLAFQQGVLFSARVVETQGYLDYCAPPHPNASIRIPTWAIIMAISGIETLMELGSLGEAHFKAEKPLTAWE